MARGGTRRYRKTQSLPFLIKEHGRRQEDLLLLWTIWILDTVFEERISTENLFLQQLFIHIFEASIHRDSALRLLVIKVLLVSCICSSVFDCHVWILCIIVCIFFLRPFCPPVCLLPCPFIYKGALKTESCLYPCS